MNSGFNSTPFRGFTLNFHETSKILGRAHLSFSDDPPQRKQLSTSLNIGYNIPKTRLFLELGINHFYHFDFDYDATLFNYRITESGEAGSLLWSYDLKDLTPRSQMTLGANIGFGLLIDKGFLWLPIPERFFAKFGGQYYLENPYQPFEETKLRLGFHIISVQGTFGVKIF